MKELSTEEKAIAYDEVIERANSLLSGNELGNAWIYKLLPELRESEDERIRKALISILKSDFEKDTTIYDISIGNIIAWLEKHGENTYNKELSELLHKVICRFINDPDIPYSDRVKVSMKVLPYVERLEKQGEQTYVKWSYDEGKQIQINPSEYINDMGGNGCYLKNPEQDSTWSEEDEMIALSIEQVMNCASLLNIVPEKIDKIRTWLKSLKDRVAPQPKQGWSEEDKKMLDYALDMIEWYGGKNEDKSRLVSDWLKSLRPQKHWKPTEAQLASLEIACDRNDRVGFDLTELLKGLKKYGGCSMLSQWKPSDGQMEALHTYIYNPQYFSSPDPRMELVESVYKDLKRLKGE